MIPNAVAYIYMYVDIYICYTIRASVTLAWCGKQFKTLLGFFTVLTGLNNLENLFNKACKD